MAKYKAMRKALDELASEWHILKGHIARAEKGQADWDTFYKDVTNAQLSLRALRAKVSSQRTKTKRAACTHPEDKRFTYSDGSSLCKLCLKPFKPSPMPFETTAFITFTSILKTLNEELSEVAIMRKAWIDSNDGKPFPAHVPTEKTVAMSALVRYAMAAAWFTMMHHLDDDPLDVFDADDEGIKAMSAAHDAIWKHLTTAEAWAIYSPIHDAFGDGIDNGVTEAGAKLPAPYPFNWVGDNMVEE